MLSAELFPCHNPVPARVVVVLLRQEQVKHKKRLKFLLQSFELKGVCVSFSTKLPITENNFHYEHLNAPKSLPGPFRTGKNKGRRQENMTLRHHVSAGTRKNGEYFPLNVGNYHDRRGALQTVSK